MRRFLASPSAQLVAACVPIGLGLVAAARGDAAAGIVFLAVAVAIVCTVLRHQLGKGPRR